MTILSSSRRTISRVRGTSGAGHGHSLLGRPSGTAATFPALLLAATLKAGLILAFATELSAQAVSFAPRQDFPAGQGPNYIVPGDFNKDGKPDIAVTNSRDNTVLILLGTGDGSLQRGVTLPTQSIPFALAVGDVNADGSTDLVVSNNGASSISVFLGRGDGSFQGALNVPTGAPFPRNVILGDFNGDNKLDLALSSGAIVNGAANVEVRLGNGDGSFPNTAAFPVGQSPAALASADLNGDGKLDLAVVDFASNSAIILLGSGTGQFTRAASVPLGVNPNSLVAADLNGDRKPDLVSGNPGSRNVSIALGRGDGSFAPPSAVGFGTASISPLGLTAADFDGDGKLDLACADPTGIIAILRGLGDGTFQAPQTFSSGSQPAFLLSTDLNRDARPDLVTANFPVNTVSALLNIPPATPSRFSGRWRDPKSQIVTINQTGNAVALQYGGETLTGTAQGDTGLRVNFSTACCTGTIIADGSRIDWSDGTSWYRPYLGRWTDMVNDTIAVNQSGSTLALQFASGRTATGTPQGDSNLNVAFSQGCCTGTVAADGKQINWSNGTTWNFLRVLPSVTGVGIVTTIAGNGLAGFGGDGGAAVRASLNGPLRLALDSAGNIFIADRRNNRIRKVTTDGTMSTFAGNGAAEFSGDGGPAASAGLNSPTGVFADASGNVFIADFGNNRVRKVAANGNISTVAGTGQSGFSGDAGPAANAAFAGPSDVAADGFGNLYVIDFNNLRLRKIGTEGIVNTIAGGGQGIPPGEGAPSIGSNLGGLFGLTLGTTGNVFLATGLLRVVEITAAGTIHFTGIGLNLNNIFGLATDQAGNLYLADPNTNQIARFSPTLNTFVYVGGSASPGFSGDGGPPSGATFNQPIGLAVDPQGAVYVVDSGNQRVRKITPPPVVSSPAIVNAASFRAGTIAASEFISLFGSGFSPRILSASAFPSPEPLGGVSIKLRDSSGTELAAPLLFIAPGQITCLVPEGLKTGPVILTVNGADGQSSATNLLLSSVAPGLFSANATGKGVAAANAVRVGADGSQMPMPVFQCAGGGCTPVAINLGQPSDQTYLTLFGTGIRGRSDPSDVAVQIGGQAATLLFAGAQGSFPGLDQVNILIPRSLAGSGTVDVVLSVGDQTANAVTISVQ